MITYFYKRVHPSIHLCVRLSISQARVEIKKNGLFCCLTMNHGQILSVTTIGKSNSKVIVTRTKTPKITSDCGTLFDLFLQRRILTPASFFFLHNFLTKRAKNLGLVTNEAKRKESSNVLKQGQAPYVTSRHN